MRQRQQFLITNILQNIHQLSDVKGILRPRMLHVKLFLNNVLLMELDVYYQLPA